MSVSTKRIRFPIIRLWKSISSARSICGPKEYLISASLGVCACSVSADLSLDQILAEADRSLYLDKSARKAAAENLPKA